MEQITIEEFQNRLSENPDLHVLDVREQDEYDFFNIGAKLLPLSEIKNLEVEAIEDWKDKGIIVHCRSGQRSIQACMILQSLGFSNLFNLEGGIEAWRKINGTQKIR